MLIDPALLAAPVLLLTTLIVLVTPVGELLERVMPCSLDSQIQDLVNKVLEYKCTYKLKDKDNEEQFNLLLIYNSVQGYVSAINKLQSNQVALKQNSVLALYNVAIKALETLIIYKEHNQRCWNTRTVECQQLETGIQLRYLVSVVKLKDWALGSRQKTSTSRHLSISYLAILCL